MTVFGEQYAAAYDALYEDKDYEAECDLLDAVFARYAPEKVHRVLDLGCGTGNHAVPLSRRGYEVVGVDRSPHMLERARARGSAARFIESDLARLELSGECFDAALMMFGVLSYQVENQAALGALRSARQHLDPGGLLVCDVWYGPAVLAQRPSERVKVVEQQTTQVIRVASSELDTRRNTCTVHYRVWRIEHVANERRVSDETREHHDMRYFFEPELHLLLSEAGFEAVALSAFPSLDEPPTQATWNVLLVARAAS
ncbi:MAG: class I SAM-dependent methyltransferase [Chloroflexi bacterium]|nr:class I SAM-dependent methyltransferase [Chloroflexota bacterium]